MFSSPEILTSTYLLVWIGLYIFGLARVSARMRKATFSWGGCRSLLHTDQSQRRPKIRSGES